ncbi:hypothetical protein VTK56DRAFT_1533 [Thermocarpiscus australiensis]
MDAGHGANSCPIKQTATSRMSRMSHSTYKWKRGACLGVHMTQRDTARLCKQPRVQPNSRMLPRLEANDSFTVAGFDSSLVDRAAQAYNKGHSKGFRQQTVPTTPSTLRYGSMATRTQPLASAWPRWGTRISSTAAIAIYTVGFLLQFAVIQFAVENRPIDVRDTRCRILR